MIVTIRRLAATGILFFAAAVAAPPATAGERLPVGRFRQDGRYRPHPRRARFRELHRLGDVPRYPVVMVHGQGGFDRIRVGPFYGDYFNGVKRVFKKAGVPALFPEVPPFGGIKERAQRLKEQILATGWEKVNLVCHSMGGLDSRYMVTHLGMADKVASITTVATPHHGSWYADFVLEWVFEKQRFWKVWDLMGLQRDSIPDLTVAHLEGEFNPNTPDMPQVRYFSIGGSQSTLRTLLPFQGARVIMSILEKRAAGKKLSLAQRLAARALLPKAARERLAAGPATIRGALGVRGDWVVPELAGKNDCMVSVSSAMWGEYLGTVDADHFDQPGWFGAFKAPRFYRGITIMLADAGF